MTTALLLPIAGATPALAVGEPEITLLEITDGTADGTGSFMTYAPGTALTIRINGADTGTFSFTGCVGYQSYSPVTEQWSEYIYATANPSTFTWTAGASMETFFPSFVDLDAASGTAFYMNLFKDSEDTPGTCEDIDYSNGVNFYEYVTDIQLDLFDPESMTLTGDVKLGSKVTAAAKVPGSLVGNDFDLWACPDQTIYPDDDAQNGNGDCYGPLIQGREGDSTEFVLGYDPARDGDSAEDKAAAEAEWENFCGKYFIVHDYPSGGHSNWIGPIDCTVAAAAKPALAVTGAGDSATTMSLAALAAMVIGGTLLIVRRTVRASNR